MPTRPQIMPLTPPRKVAFFSLPNDMSMMIHTIMATAVARLVLITADAASALHPRPDHCRSHEAGDAGCQVDDVAAAEVQRALPRPESAAPEQERVHRIGKRDPQWHEYQPHLEFDPPEHGADEQDRRNRGEHE